MATNFRGKIGKIGLLSFIRRSGIPKRIRLFQCRFFKKGLSAMIWLQRIKIWWNLST